MVHTSSEGVFQICTHGLKIFEAPIESSEDEEEKAEKKSLNERQARLKKELNDESNNGKTIEESNSEASSSSDEDCDDPNDPDVENSSEMKKQLASLEDNEFCGRDSGCTCILALYQV